MPLPRTPDRRVRPLTPDEIALARLVFRDAIDYSMVRIHARPYLPFGLQPPHTAMAPNGSLYFPPACHQDDFAACGIPDQMWFIHEMTHVWQFQLGYWVRARGAIRIGLDYGYRLDVARRLSDYNMEAQGNLLADYFALRFRDAPSRLYEARYRHAPDALALFETVLADFIAAPSDRRHLPKRRAARLFPDDSR